MCWARRFGRRTRGTEGAGGATVVESHRRHSPTSTSTPSSRCSTGRPGSTSWWPRRWPTGSRRSGSPITATCTATLEFYKECRAQGIKPVIGTEAYMAHDHRSERPTRRGRVDDSGGDTEGGKKLYYHLTLLAESDDVGYRNLIQLSSKAFLEGYYYKPRLDWELLADHSQGLIATTGCLGGHVLQSLLQGDEQGALEKAGRLQEIFGRDNLFVELQDHGLPAQRRDQPQADRAGHQVAGAAAGHQRLALHPPRGPRVPRRPAVRADRRRAVGPEALQVRGPRALPQDRRRDALPLPRGARGLRQHAVDRRAGRGRDRVRRPAAAELPAARGLHRRRRLPRPRHVGGRPRRAGATPSRRPPGLASSTSSTPSPRWASAPTS